MTARSPFRIRGDVVSPYSVLTSPSRVAARLPFRKSSSRHRTLPRRMTPPSKSAQESSVGGTRTASSAFVRSPRLRPRIATERVAPDLPSLEVLANDMAHENTCHPRSPLNFTSPPRGRPAADEFRSTTTRPPSVATSGTAECSGCLQVWLPPS